MDVHSFCTGCLSTDRELVLIRETSLSEVYSQILQEISDYKSASIPIQLCFECRARVKHYQKFRSQATNSYIHLFNYIQGTSKPVPINQFKLEIYPEYKLNYNPEEENNIHAITLNTQDDKDTVKLEKIDIDIDTVKSEHNYLSDSYDGHYSEPETFTKQLDLINPEVNVKKKRKKKKVKVPNIESDDDLNLKELKEKKCKDVKVFNCEKCNVICKSEKALLTHTKKHRKLSENKCDICSIECSTKTELRKHIKEHTRIEPKPSETDAPIETVHSCDMCSEKFMTLDKIQLHMIRVHKQRPECKECGKLFSSRKTYRYHIKVIHKGHNRFPCPQCGKVYQWKSNLWRHLKNHKARDNGELYCLPCDRKFSSVATFQHHLRLSKSHVTENAYTYMCSECGKKFVNKTRLKDHVNWEHLKKINYRCQKCNKPFKSSTSLYVHLHNVHKNKEEKDNLCHVCGKSYQNIAKLKYHIIAMHTNVQPYACTICHATFSWYSSLYRHTRDLHHKVKIKKLKKEKKESECRE